MACSGEITISFCPSLSNFPGLSEQPLAVYYLCECSMLSGPACSACKVHNLNSNYNPLMLISSPSQRDEGPRQHWEAIRREG